MAFVQPSWCAGLTRAHAHACPPARSLARTTCGGAGASSAAAVARAIDAELVVADALHDTFVAMFEAHIDGDSERLLALLRPIRAPACVWRAFEFRARARRCRRR